MVEKAVFGAGCFWCIEACFKDLKGVISVTPGYCGGDPSRTSYEEVCEGDTGHAEVALIEFDPEQVSFQQLLELFWFVHDPTQLNRQGNDIGTQYRSVIFYNTEEQRMTSTASKQMLEQEEVWERPIVTEVVPMSTFYPAENYHKNYFELNPGNMYCQSVVRPKVEKFRKVFQRLLK